MSSTDLSKRADHVAKFFRFFSHTELWPSPTTVTGAAAPGCRRRVSTALGIIIADLPTTVTRQSDRLFTSVGVASSSTESVTTTSCLGQLGSRGMPSNAGSSGGSVALAAATAPFAADAPLAIPYADSGSAARQSTSQILVRQYDCRMRSFQFAACMGVRDTV